MGRRHRRGARPRPSSLSFHLQGAHSAGMVSGAEGFLRYCANLPLMADLIALPDRRVLRWRAGPMRRGGDAKVCMGKLAADRHAGASVAGMFCRV